MQNALQISHWLRAGVTELPQADRNKLRLLLTRYPCFLPLKALAAAAHESEEASAEAIYFSGLNPVLLQALKSRSHIVSEPVSEAAATAATENNSPQTAAESSAKTEETILVHLPASEDTGEVNLEPDLPPAATALPEETAGETETAEAEEKEVPPTAVTEAEPEAATEIQEAEEPQSSGAVPPEPEATPEKEPANILEAEDADGVLTHLPPSENTEEVNLPADAEEKAPETTAPEVAGTELEETESADTETPAAAEDSTLAADLEAAEKTPGTDKDFGVPASESVSPAPSLSDASPLPVPPTDFNPKLQLSSPEGEESRSAEEEEVIQPLYANDYFLHQGVANGEDTLPKSGAFAKQKSGSSDLMIMRSFAEWLRFFQSLKTEAGEEEAARRAVKASWQKERLAAALEEEEEEIPEVVFEMALTSIAPEGNMASEPLALIYAKQGKWEKAIEVYQRLQLRNPQKSAYFAEKIAVLEQQHRP